MGGIVATGVVKADWLEIDVSGSSDVTLTTAQARTGYLKFTGTLTGSINVIVPDGEGYQWWMWNGTGGAFTLTVKTAGAAGIVLVQGNRARFTSDGTQTVQEAAQIPAAGVFAAPTATGAANSEGTAATFARSDHVHAMGSASADGSTLEVNAGAMRMKDGGTTAAKLATAVQDVIPYVTITAAAEVGDARVVTIKLYDAAGNALADRFGATVWLGDSAHSAPTADPPSGGWTATAGYVVNTLTANVHAEWVSDANGEIQITISEAGADSWWVHARMGWKVTVSSEVAFT